jgi:hypothetical protein
VCVCVCVYVCVCVHFSSCANNCSRILHFICIVCVCAFFHLIHMCAPSLICTDLCVSRGAEWALQIMHGRDNVDYIKEELKDFDLDRIVFTSFYDVVTGIERKRDMPRWLMDKWDGYV